MRILPKNRLLFNTIIKNTMLCALCVLLNGLTSSYAETIAATTFGPSSTIPDATLLKNVQTAVAKKLSAQGVKLTLTAQNGIVVLTGEVQTTDQAIDLVEDILSTNGVFDVNTDNFKVADNNPDLMNLLITARVKGMLIREKFFGDITVKQLPITVYTRDGIVYLQGIVDNQTQLLNIIRAVQAMRSIPRVISLLQIRTISVNIN